MAIFLPRTDSRPCRPISAARCGWSAIAGEPGLPEPAQAAEHFLRSHTGVLGIDALTMESVTEAPVSEVIIRLGGERYRIGVERIRLDACDPECTDSRATYLLRDLSRLSSDESDESAMLSSLPG